MNEDDMESTKKRRLLEALLVRPTIRQAAEDAGVVVYLNCTPSQEVRDNGTEIDWFAEWCATGHEWDESQWIEWFRKQ